jgi:starvation-inducible DNA-binding protein
MACHHHFVGKEPVVATSALNVKPTPETDLEPRERLAANLTAMLADAYVLMVKTQGLHWNVVGPLFVSLHQLTEQQYQDLLAAIDEIAERIRALGHLAPTSFSGLAPHSAIAEANGSNFSARQMVTTLIDDHETVARRLRDAVEVAEGFRDAATADMLTERLQVHEKAVWMLRAIIAA